MENNSLVNANLKTLKFARSDKSDTCILGPGNKNFDHLGSLRSKQNSILTHTPRDHPQKFSEETLEKVLRFRSAVRNPEDSKARFKYQIKHSGGKAVLGNFEQKHNIFGQVADQMLQRKEQTCALDKRQNSYGLSKEF